MDNSAENLVESFIKLPIPYITKYQYESNENYVKIYNNMFDIFIKNKVITVWDKICNRLYSNISLAYHDYNKAFNI